MCVCKRTEITAFVIPSERHDQCDYIRLTCVDFSSTTKWYYSLECRYMYANFISKNNGCVKFVCVRVCVSISPVERWGLTPLADCWMVGSLSEYPSCKQEYPLSGDNPIENKHPFFLAEVMHSTSLNIVSPALKKRTL